MIRKAAAVLLLGLIFSPVYAETFIDNNIEKSQVWTAKNSPYVISDTVNINKQVMINIEPGTVVKFRKNGSLIVDGVLNCRGNAENPVRLIPYDNESFYDGIRIQGKYKSEISNTVIIRGAVILDGGSLVFSGNYMLNSTGIELFTGSKAVIRDNYFLNNTYGVYVEGQEMGFTVTGNTFSRNRYAVYVNKIDNSRTLIEKNNFLSNIVNITNYSPVNLEAKNNFWNYTDESRITVFLYGKRNNPKSGEIIYKPFFEKSMVLYLPSVEFQEIVKILLNQKKPEEEKPRIGFSVGATGFMPLSPDSLAKEGSLGSGFSGECDVNFNGWFMLGLEGKLMSMSSVKELYNFNMDITDIMLNAYAYLGYKKGIYFVPYVRLGNGVSLISRQYQYMAGGSKKMNSLDYNFEFALGAEYFVIRYFSLRADAGFNYTLSQGGGGNIMYPTGKLAGYIYFDTPLFLSE